MRVARLDHALPRWVRSRRRALGLTADASLQKALLDRVYDRRKAAALELERYVAGALGGGGADGGVPARCASAWHVASGNVWTRLCSSCVRC